MAKASDRQLAALGEVVTGIRPAWGPVVARHLVDNAELLDFETLARRAVGAACDPDVKVPSAMLTWEPGAADVDTKDPKGRQPEPLERWAAAPRCGHGAILGRCALCRRGVPPEDAPTRGQPRTREDA